MKFFIPLYVFVMASVAFAQQNLPLFAKDNPESKKVAELTYVDVQSIEELPIPPLKKKVVSYEADKKKLKACQAEKTAKKVKACQKKVKKKKVVKMVEVERTSPPEYIPVKTRLGEGFVRRADLARFKERASDQSGKYSSLTGHVILEKSPNNPGKFNITIQNGPVNGRAEIAAGGVPVQHNGSHERFHYTEPGCTIDIDLFLRQVQVAESGCKEYHVGDFGFAGKYERYEELNRKAETFNGEMTYKGDYKKFMWCPAGESSCEKIKDEEGCKVEIVWSVDGTGMIERRCGEGVHKYRPMERMIPHREDFYNGEKPIMWKTKRADMAKEWMVWYNYPKAKRFKMVRFGDNAATAYMEIYE